MVHRTEGIRYSGSKKNLLPHIHQLTLRTGARTVLDGFTGTTRVSQMFSDMGLTVTSNDLSEWSRVFGECYLLDTNSPEHYKGIIDHLNNLTPVRGWFTETYGGAVTDDERGSAVQPDGLKRPWQVHNTTKLDAIREEIDRISEGTEKSVLLTSLILALDKVDNGLGHQVAYLKNWSPRSHNVMKMNAPSFPGNRGPHHRVVTEDITGVSGSFDLVYLDPPYGTNNDRTKTTRVRYASYYHLWKTVILNDRPKVFGAALRRADVSSDTLPGAVSPYENTDQDKVYESMYDMLTGLNTEHFIFSYNNKGRVSIEKLVEMFSDVGELKETVKISHKENIQRLLTLNNNWLGDQGENYEYLFLVKK